jgi:hypothetical protein
MTRLTLRRFELLAAPLVAESALDDALTDLDPALRAPATVRLWRQTERSLLARTASFTIDELVSLRDETWFGARMRHTHPVPLDEYVTRHAERLLEARGTQAVPRAQAQPPDRDDRLTRTEWRWLTLNLPGDLLIAALPGGDALASRVKTLSPMLERRLHDDGYAETHLHLFAAIDFPSLWAMTLWNLCTPSFSERSFESPGAVLGEGRQLARWVVLAAITRGLLASFLASSSRRQNGRFDSWLASARTRVPSERSSLFSASLAAVRELVTGGQARSSASFAELKSTLARMSELRLRRPSLPRDIEEIDEADPIAPLLPRRSLDSTCEMRFVRAGLEHLPNHRDPLFARAFWQVVRARVIYYQHVVQRPLAPGLLWFNRNFRRMEAGKQNASPRLFLSSAFRLGGAGLRSLEVRMSPWNTLSGLRSLLREFVAPPRRAPRPGAPPRAELALVFHFIKLRAEGSELPAWGRGFHADPCKPANLGYRFGKYHRDRLRESLALEALLAQYPASLALLRAIDVCTDEQGVPTWPLVAPVLRVRRASNRAALVASRRLGFEVPPLRATIHAGEDFVHLGTGLRRIHESIERFELREGDRLGHAVALGLNPRRWSEHTPRLLMPVEERLFDLLWELSLYARGALTARAGRGVFAECSALDLARTIFDQPASLVDLQHLAGQLCNDRALGLDGFPYGHPRPRHPALLSRYLTEGAVYARSRALVEVDVPRETDTLIDLQGFLRREVSRRGLVVEINPSSNLLVVDLRDLGDHPLWELRPPRGEGTSGVALSVGSDDPLPCATTLPEEYQLLYDALVRGGTSSDQALDWLEHARRTGLDARFSLPQGRDVDPFANPTPSGEIVPIRL